MVLLCFTCYERIPIEHTSSKQNAREHLEKGYNLKRQHTKDTRG
jgi:hypothetical protein